MAAETQYTPNTGGNTINYGNSSLTGGTVNTDIWNVFSAASGLGSFIRTVTIKAQSNTTKGMVRLFVYNGSANFLLREIEIPAVVKSATSPAFQITIPLYFDLKQGHKLRASTQNSDTFNVIVEGYDWTYYASSVRSDTTKYTTYNAATTISTANSNLNGTGAMGTALVSSGCNILSVTIKAKQSTTDGMIRLFIYCNSPATTTLFMEIPVPAVTCSSIAPSFYKKIVFKDGFALKSNWELRVSTENAEAFNVITESLDLSYPA